MRIRREQVQNVYCAIWTECIWSIANATASATKFLLSDHPVTVYNHACFPKSQWCDGVNDPDIRCSATHTLFPLNLHKILIFTKNQAPPARAALPGYSSGGRRLDSAVNTAQAHQIGSEARPRYH